MSEILKLSFLLLLLVGISVLFYFNTAASIITAREKSLTFGIKISRIAFVWLIPIIGFSFSLRFSHQAAQNKLHYQLVPKLVRNWIYDESVRPPNKNRDDDDFKAIGSGIKPD